MWHIVLTNNKRMLGMLRQDFEAAVEAAKAGDVIPYHTGDLRYDRQCGQHFQAVDNTGRAAMAAFEAGKVQLAQVRIRPNVFVYVAIKRPPPHRKVEWLGCYNPAPLYSKPLVALAKAA